MYKVCSIISRLHPVYYKCTIIVFVCYFSSLYYIIQCHVNNSFEKCCANQFWHDFQCSTVKFSDTSYATNLLTTTHYKQTWKWNLIKHFYFIDRVSQHLGALHLFHQLILALLCLSVCLSLSSLFLSTYIDLFHTNTKARKERWMVEQRHVFVHKSVTDRKFILIQGIILITPCPGTHYTCNVSCFCPICCQLSMFSILVTVGWCFLSFSAFFWGDGGLASVQGYSVYTMLNVLFWQVYNTQMCVR